MKSSVRLSLTLMFVGIIAAAVLSLVNGVTAPVIAAREAEEFQEAVGSFLPSSVRFEEEAVDKIQVLLGYDDADQLEGLVATVTTAGYNGLIEYNLAVSAGGEIIGIRIVNQQETPGLGDVIIEPEFQEQILGKKISDPIRIGEDVDIVSGATISTRAMLTSVREALDIIGPRFLK